MNRANESDLVISVRDVQDSPPYFVNLPYLASIPENSTKVSRRFVMFLFLFLCYCFVCLLLFFVCFVVFLLVLLLLGFFNVFLLLYF